MLTGRTSTPRGSRLSEDTLLPTPRNRATKRGKNYTSYRPAPSSLRTIAAQTKFPRSKDTSPTSTLENRDPTHIETFSGLQSKMAVGSTAQGLLASRRAPLESTQATKGEVRMAVQQGHPSPYLTVTSTAAVKKEISSNILPSRHKTEAAYSVGGTRAITTLSNHLIRL